MKRYYISLLLICWAIPLRADIIVENAFVPEMPPSSPVYAAYLSITNTGEETRTLTGAKAVGFNMTHLHETVEKNGVTSMKMRHHLTINAGETKTLKPGGLHLMLMKPQDSAIKNKEIVLLLSFKNGETLSVIAPLQVLN